MSVHVYPVNDSEPHVLRDDGSECACDPDIQWIDPATDLPYPAGPLVTHNPFDGRDPRDKSFATQEGVE